MDVTAHVERSGDWWVITIPDIEGGIHTQARRLDQVEVMAAGAVADLLEIPVESVRVTLTGPGREAAVAAMMADGLSRDEAEFALDMDRDAYEAGELSDP